MTTDKDRAPHSGRKEPAAPAGSLRGSGIQLDSFVENLPGNLVRRVLHPDGRFSYSFLSASLRETFGIEPEEIMQQRQADFSWVHADDREAFRQALLASARDLMPLDLENRVIGRDGTVKWVRSIGEPRRLDSGAVVWDGIALDVTDKKLAEAEMREALLRAEKADAAKSKFLAAASHDLRQPLQAMRFHLAALDAADTTPAQAGAAVQGLGNCVDSMEALLNSLLDISKLDAGVVTPVIEAIDLGGLAAALAEEIRPLAADRQIRFEVPADGLTVACDRSLLTALLRNLVQNALKYTAADGRVVVRVRPAGGRTWIIVADDGIGIARTDQARVFEPFVQIGNDARDRSKGLGLGLAIVERISELLSIAVRLRSTPGRGSVFALVLPEQATQGTASTAPPPEAPAEGGSLAGRRIWLLEDDSAVAQSLTELLRLWGAEVATAETAGTFDALARAGGPPPDLMIADLRTRSRRTGGEAIHDVRNAFRRPIPGIILTGDTDPERLREQEVYGLRVLHKPVKPGKLRALIRYCLEADAA